MIKIEGVRQVNNALAVAGAAIGEALGDSIEELGEIGEAAAKRGAPRDTGLLEESIGSLFAQSKRGTVATVGVRDGFKREITTKEGHRDVRDPTKYAHLQEFGTVHSAAKPFMRPALVTAEQAAESVVTNNVGRAIG